MTKSLFLSLILILFLIPLSVVGAQGDSVGALRINALPWVPELCTAGQAQRIYDSYDKYLQAIDNMVLAQDIHEASQDPWLFVSSFKILSDHCEGSFFLQAVLLDIVVYMAYEFYMGDMGGIDAERYLRMLRDVMKTDRALIRQEHALALDSELKINQIVNGIAECTPHQALTFYNSLDGFERQMEKRKLVTTDDSLKLWVRIFQRWISIHWALFYEQPCGNVLTHIYLLETAAYMATATETADVPQNLHNAILPTLYKFAAHDWAIIDTENWRNDGP